MKLEDFSRLKKFLMLATSDNDAEALTSFRRATEVLRSYGFTWDDAMDRRIIVLSAVEAGDPADTGLDEAASPRPAGRRPAAADEELEQDFDMALRIAHGSFRDTLLSIQAQWEEQGWISDAQRQVVTDAAERAAERQPAGRIR
jgi:hypothetical protein